MAKEDIAFSFDAEKVKGDKDNEINAEQPKPGYMRIAMVRVQLAVLCAIIAMLLNVTGLAVFVRFSDTMPVPAPIKVCVKPPESVSEEEITTAPILSASTESTETTIQTTITEGPTTTAGPSSICTSDPDVCAAAIQNATCDRNTSTCQCLFPGNYGEIGNDSCIEVSLGSNCSTTPAVCTAVGKAECSVATGTCACQDGYYGKDSGLSCIQVLLGQICNGYLPEIGYLRAICSGIPNAVCQLDSMVCVCSEGYKVDADGRWCIQAVLGSSCAKESDCSGSIQNSTCHAVSRRCVCLPGFGRTSNDECIQVVLHVTSCFDYPAMCHEAIRYSECWSTTCQCKHGFTESNNQCHSRAGG